MASTRRPLRILFDAQRLTGDKTGVEYYTAGLIASLAARHPDNLQLIGYHSAPFSAASAAPAAPNLSYRRVWLPAKAINLLRRLGLTPPVELLTGCRADFVLYPNFLGLPSLLRTPSAAVIHDLTFVDLPDYVAPRNLSDLRRFVPRQLRSDSFTITVSEFGKQRLRDVFSVSAGRVLVTPIPPEPPRHFSAAAERQTLSRLGLNGKYLLTLGTIEPRKNLLAMLDAYTKLPPAVQKEYAFVSAGKIGWNCDAELARLDELRRAGANVIRVGYVTDDERAALYHNAALFTWASHYEGFGMPILEAMSYGIPCAISDIPVFREVAQDAALYFNQKRSETIAKTWLRVLQDSKLHQQLSHAGKQRAGGYHWNDVADSLYNRIMQTLESR